MTQVIDLPRVRRALDELDRIAAEHPEAFAPDRLRLLTENLEETLMHPPRNRMKAYRDRQVERGMKRITIAISREAAQALQALQAVGRYKSAGEVVSHALLNTAITELVGTADTKGKKE